MKLRKRREPTEKRFRRMKKRYTEKPAQSIRLAVVDCFFWNGLTDAQTAEILGTSTDVIHAEVDRLIQTHRRFFRGSYETHN